MTTGRVRFAATGTAVLLTCLAVAPPAHAATGDRIAGGDRYETAVKISQRLHHEPVGTVFLASGEDYPDALVAGAGGSEWGYPVLLTRPDRVPDVVMAELKRLDPAFIVLVGGERALSVEIERQVRDVSAFRRLAGADRYETATLLAEWSFSEGVPTLYVASGADFPDALTASAVAGASGGPVLLTRPGDLPAVTSTAFDKLKPRQIVVVGGETAVSPGVVSSLERIAPTTRQGSHNRFATAATMASAYTSAQTVYLASGTSFPDALVGAPLAASMRAPMLLVEQDAVSDEVCAEVGRLGASSVVALGGEAAVSQAVLDDVTTRCAVR